MEEPSEPTCQNPVPSRADSLRSNASALVRSISSEVLLQGQSMVSIEHNGVCYRLQATRSGKLILTK